ncbi:MAG: STAS domain-containing protein [Phycisphaerae bacterium]|jgi:anti-sigma B factor antagonist
MPDTPDSQPRLKTRKQGNVTLVEFEDRKILEEHVINLIGERLAEIVETQNEPRLLLDFRNVEHLSSAALGMLITLKKQLDDRQGRMALANIHAQILEVFKITRLNKLFNIQNNTEDAIQSLA